MPKIPDWCRSTIFIKKACSCKVSNGVESVFDRAVSFFNLIETPSIHFSSIVKSKWWTFACGTDICQKTTTAGTSCEFANLVWFSCVIVGVEVAETKLSVLIEAKTPQFSKGGQHQRVPKSTADLPDDLVYLENFERFLNSHIMEDVYANLVLSLCFLIFQILSIVKLTPFHTISVCKRDNWSVVGWYFLALEREFYMLQCFSVMIF